MPLTWMLSISTLTRGFKKSHKKIITIAPVEDETGSKPTGRARTRKLIRRGKNEPRIPPAQSLAESLVMIDRALVPAMPILRRGADSGDPCDCRWSQERHERRMRKAKKKAKKQAGYSGTAKAISLPNP
ncbi:hypothetical protein FA15DRAFT_700900 [Coprinopsis marcescibilis]|uniref:Uncharacterized protein n=1 Tax=Coprinopsis marcescibilis TaxID=230819 RepID=A0A5C3L7M5_COPMA|nr:hypothetical protein FA15DRAFT_700900 [Coprinopsis marcescibilis]